VQKSVEVGVFAERWVTVEQNFRWEGKPPTSTDGVRILKGLV